MITIEDIRSDSNESGFAHVCGLGNGRGARPTAKPRWRAEVNKGKGRTVATGAWQGPHRRTPEEAAQDYCDYMNGKTTPATPVLKSAGHKRTSPALPTNEAIQEARQNLRDLLAAERQGRQGYLYLIGETFGRTFFDATMDKGELIADAAVKIGYSDAPDARIAMLQTGNPRKLVLLGTIEGTLDDERALHAKYISDNVLQEWFRPTQALLSEFGITTSVMGGGCLWVEKEREAA